MAELAAVFERRLEDLTGDSIKLIAYTLVCLEYGAERILEKGTGQLLITEPMSREQFIAHAFANYAEGLRRDGDSELLNEYNRIEPGALGIHFAIARQWPKRESRLAEKRVDALRSITRTAGGR